MWTKKAAKVAFLFCGRFVRNALVSEIAAVLVPISDWIRHLCGIQLTPDGRDDENDNQWAQEFKDRWEFVNNFIAHQIRNTPADVKMRGKQIVVIIISLALLLAALVALRRLREKPIGPSVSETSRVIGGRAFEVQVEMPAFNSGRAPWEIPGAILGYDRGPRFDQASPGAQVGKMAPDHIELRADGGWDLLIETDAEGRLAHETHVAFPVKLGGRPLKFNCQPADPAVGYLHTTARPDSDELEGDFQLEIAICKNAASGKTAAWPYKPLKVRGNFAGLRKQGSSELLPTPGTGIK